VVETSIVPGRYELPAVTGTNYTAFVDPSGGSSDSMTIAVAHRDKGDRLILDAIRERRPPFSPAAVVEEFAALLKTYRLSRIVGDRYGGEWPRERFREHGITYETSERTKSEIYLESLPRLNGAQIELLDNPRLANQIIGLERRTARGGKDSIDHGPGAHDDVANSALGALVLAAVGRPGLTFSPELMARVRGAPLQPGLFVGDALSARLRGELPQPPLPPNTAPSPEQLAAMRPSSAPSQNRSRLYISNALRARLGSGRAGVKL
jgi:hypothetical protein